MSHYFPLIHFLITYIFSHISPLYLPLIIFLSYFSSLSPHSLSRKLVIYNPFPSIFSPFPTYFHLLSLTPFFPAQLSSFFPLALPLCISPHIAPHFSPHVSPSHYPLTFSPHIFPPIYSPKYKREINIVFCLCLCVVFILILTRG